MKKVALVSCMLFILAGCAQLLEVGSLPTQEQIQKEYCWTNAECPPGYREKIKEQLGSGLYDPYSAVYRFSVPEKYVYQKNFGYRVFVTINAKNRYGAYVGEQEHMFMCFSDGTVREINEALMGMRQGARDFSSK